MGKTSWWHELPDDDASDEMFKKGMDRCLELSFRLSTDLNRWIEILQKETDEPHVITKRYIGSNPKFPIHRIFLRKLEIFEEPLNLLMNHPWEDEVVLQIPRLLYERQTYLNINRGNLNRYVESLTKFSYLERLHSHHNSKKHGKTLIPLYDIRKALLADQTQGFRVFHELQTEVSKNCEAYLRKIEVHQSDHLETSLKTKFSSFLKANPHSLLEKISKGYFLMMLAYCGNHEVVKSPDRNLMLASSMAQLSNDLRKELFKALSDIDDSFVSANKGKNKHEPFKEALSKLVEEHGFNGVKDFIKFIDEKIAEARRESTKSDFPVKPVKPVEIEEVLSIADIPCTDGDVEIFLRKDPVEQVYQKRIFYAVDGDPKTGKVSYRGLSDFRDPSGRFIFPKRRYRKNKSATN